MSVAAPDKDDQAALPVVLIGMMGSGKSTIAAALAARWRLPFADTDQWIEKNSGESVAALINTRGEAAFRALETEALQQVLRPPRKIIASGGGVILSAANRALLQRAARVFYLQANPDLLAARVADSLPSRPLLQNADSVTERLRQLLNEREALYAEAAHYTIAQQPSDTVADIVGVIEARISAGAA